MGDFIPSDSDDSLPDLHTIFRRDHKQNASTLPDPNNMRRSPGTSSRKDNCKNDFISYELKTDVIECISSDDEDLEDMEARPLSWSLKKRLDKKHQDFVNGSENDKDRQSSTHRDPLVNISGSASTQELRNDPLLYLHDTDPVIYSSTYNSNDLNEVCTELPSLSSRMKYRPDMGPVRTNSDASSSLECSQTSTGTTESLSSYISSECSSNRSNVVVLENKGKANKNEAKLKTTNKMSEREKQKEAKVQEKEALRTQKEEEKAEKLRQKQLLQVEKNKRKDVIDARRNAQPGNCMKFITVILDRQVVESSSGAAILSSVQLNDLQYRVTDHLVTNAISWKRQIAEQEVDEDQLVVLIPVLEFVAMVDAYKQVATGLADAGKTDPPTLQSYGHTAQAICPDQAVTFIVQGMEKYFRDQKTMKNRSHRQAVLATDPNHGPSAAKKQRKMNFGVSVSRVNVEEAVVDLQLHTGINVKLAETAEEVANHVKCITKAVAEAPFKRERLQNIFAFHTDVGGTVKAGKDGSGLRKVWTQQIQQLKNVGPDMAAAIVNVYPSPYLLVQSYRSCSSTKQAEQLLENITVRRGAGVLETSRRIGKELSRRLYHIVMNPDPGFIIK